MQKRTFLRTVPLLLAALMIVATVGVWHSEPARAATPISGALRAKAGSGGVTAARFVKLSAAGTIVASSTVTDKIVGVCELTASANGLTRYAPMGTQSAVTSGEAITVGDLLTSGTGGKAFVLDTDDASSQRVAAMALTAASGADESVTVILMPGMVEQHNTIAALVTTDVDAGASGTAGSVDIFPATAANGKTTITATNNGAAYNLNITNAALGQTVALTIPDPGASTASVVLNKGTNTISSTDTHTGTLDVSGATVTYRSILNADINASAAIARSKLAEDALAEYGIPFTALRNASALALVAAAEDNEFGLTSAGFGTGTLVIDGDPASNESETSTLMFEFVLPPEYVAAGDVQLVVQAKESVGAATVSTTLSAEAYEVDGQGGAGSDIAGAPDVTDITTSWQTSTTAITASGLVAGDRLIVFVRIVTNDTGGAVGTVAQIGEVSIKCDIKG